MTSRKLLYCVLVIAAVVPSAAASTAVTVSAPPPAAQVGNPFSGLPYAQKAPMLEQMLRDTRSPAEQVRIAREWVRAGRHAGVPRLGQMFKNFEPGRRIDLNDPKVIDLLKKLGSTNRNVVQGAAREMVYYQKFYNSPLFSEVTVLRPVPTKSGVPSDQDISFRSNISGRRTWVEVKTTKQRLALDSRLKNQIERMGEFKGRRVIISRGRVSESVKAYAKRHGVEVYENVKASKVLETIAQSDIKNVQLRAGTSLAFGVILLSHGSYRLYYTLALPGEMDAERWRAVASDSTLIGAGGVQVTSGVLNLKLASLARQASMTRKVNPELASHMGRLQSAGKWVGRAGWVLIVVYEGIEVYRWRAGDINTRQFAQTTGGLGTALGGALAGAGIGALVDGPLPIGEIVGGLVGGTIGFFAGRKAGDVAYEAFIFSSAEMKARKLEIMAAALRQ